MSVFTPTYDGLYRSVWRSRALLPAGTLVAAGILRAPLSLTRTGAAATALNTDAATFTTYAANLPRYNGAARGLLLEGGRTNLFLNSAVGATQGVTVAAALHQLSFYGTGSITLTGTSTAGPLTGTGANNRVVLSFTPTAGTLTLTIAGDVRGVMLEQATAPATSWNVTTGASVARGADICNATLVALGLPASGACTVIFDGMVPITGASAAQLVQLDDGSANNRFMARFNAGSANLLMSRTNATVVANSTAVGAHTPGTAFRMALAIDGAGRMAGSLNGSAIQAVTGGVTTGLTHFRLGGDSSGAGNLFGECRNLRVFSTVAADGDLPGLATL